MKPRCYIGLASQLTSQCSTVVGRHQRNIWSIRLQIVLRKKTCWIFACRSYGCMMIFASKYMLDHAMATDCHCDFPKVVCFSTIQTVRCWQQTLQTFSCGCKACRQHGKMSKSQNISGWKGPIKTIASNSLLIAGLPTYMNHMTTECCPDADRLGAVTTSLGSLSSDQSPSQ